MKVLFAVSNEEISESIVKRYQKEYKEIISYKNVYYFNAILKELQKDKSYDRIIVSEDLEAFSNTQYSQIDKFIFDKLDSISDEAANLKGDNIPIILIASDRRQKSEEMLVKLFGIGIYDVLLGNDRSVLNVCNLLNKPRTKKEAKIYYKIEAEDVSYQSEDENDVSEVEIQNILAHYKRLGKDETKYVESFNNIVSQYNDVQLRIISKFLPLNVRAVLEEKSPKYQEIISYNSKISDTLRAQKINANKTEGTSEKLLNGNNREKILSKPVVIPSAVNMSGAKKLAKVKNEVKPIEPVVQKPKENEQETELQEIENLLEGMNASEKPEVSTVPATPLEPVVEPVIEPIEESVVEPIIETEQEDIETKTDSVQLKRGRGRPRKNPLPTPEELAAKPKRGRGRPRKNPVVIEEEQEIVDIPSVEEETTILPEIDNIQSNEQETSVLPGFDDIQNVESETSVIHGINEIENSRTEESALPEIDDIQNAESELSILPGFGSNEDVQISQGQPTIEDNDYTNTSYEDVDISSMLTTDKKIACFVGTSKNGTSFIVNNLAQITSSMGINTAILDVTKNRNSYYIYTQNEENLRKIAMSTVNNLLQGDAQGIQVNKSLTVYTSLPEESEGIENAGIVLQSLLKKHSLVLIDCDFSTPISYFAKTQELYLVQTLDILTIQPLTAFLRDLKAKGVLDQNKLRIVLNKAVKLRGVNDQVIIGGMAYYNDPSMSYMTELFNKSTVRYVDIPFSEEAYTKYLENIVNCEVSTKGYPKNIIQSLNELSNVVYPLLAIKPGKSNYTPPSVERNTFSPSINSTLDQMKKRY